MMIQIPNANDFNDFFKSNKIEKNKGIDWKKIKKNKAFEDFINEIKLNTSFALKNYGIQNIKYEHIILLCSCFNTIIILTLTGFITFCTFYG